MTVKIKGDIGIDVLGTQFSEFMSRLDGDVNVEIDSPGGFMTDGIAIANALRDYNKGKVNVRVVGQASSMAAYIMLFGDSLSFTPNAIVCLHNPWNVPSLSLHRDFRAQDDPEVPERSVLPH